MITSKRDKWGKGRGSRFNCLVCGKVCAIKQRYCSPEHKREFWRKWEREKYHRELKYDKKFLARKNEQTKKYLNSVDPNIRRAYNADRWAKYNRGRMGKAGEGGFWNNLTIVSNGFFRNIEFVFCVNGKRKREKLFEPLPYWDNQ